ncbi:hypothetical protein [Paenibacillus sp. 7523-1]|uniref:hypothetical protein n=1 Tax=Paenibacillus sp. 7523-1 TaxID=2022550 RepID=UPI000BA5C616|nr:hypothetical protein [Paenibacillus sp. 7523-1]PAD29794.1 hypothetical protein CHH60_19690 [Paenibacillus sp. 7523-1]
MPLIDNYLLDNYRLEGPIQTELGVINLNTPTADGSNYVTVSAGQTPVIATYANFPAGTKSISIVPYANGQIPMVGTGNSTLDIQMIFALRDRSGRLWRIGEVANGMNSSSRYMHLLTAQIDLVSKICIALLMLSPGDVVSIPNQYNWGWYPNTTPPTGFEVDGPISLVSAVNYNNASTSTSVLHKFKNSRIMYM